MPVCAASWQQRFSLAPGKSDSGCDALVHAIVGVPRMPASTRAAWQELFSHYVFDRPDRVTAHLPRERLGLLAELGSAEAARVRRFLVERLQSPR